MEVLVILVACSLQMKKLKWTGVKDYTINKITKDNNFFSANKRKSPPKKIIKQEVLIEPETDSSDSGPELFPVPIKKKILSSSSIGSVGVGFISAGSKKEVKSPAPAKAPPKKDVSGSGSGSASGSGSGRSKEEKEAQPDEAFPGDFAMYVTRRLLKNLPTWTGSGKIRKIRKNPENPEKSGKSGKNRKNPGRDFNNVH